MNYSRRRSHESAALRAIVLFDCGKPIAFAEHTCFTLADIGLEVAFSYSIPVPREASAIAQPPGEEFRKVVPYPHNW
ncbi:MAG TPA: hypothetical protein V6C90_12145 [Coleofasciculaceae cyanobacterium]